VKLVKHPVTQIKKGDVVTTHDWSASSDGKLFTVEHVYADNWLLCLNSDRKHRQFHKDHVRIVDGEDG
jgi:hypothetical protein